jgi:SAM-dependent methyltransferase
MTMKDIQQVLKDLCYGKDAADRKNWYSPAANAYAQVRPRYPQALIDRILEITQLSSSSHLLELGCGPAIATPAFAKLGGPLLAIEPNPDFARIARETCQIYSNVRVQNCSFEEWELESAQFDAVIAASSFHWINPEIGYPKAKAALRLGGYLILLWNKEMQPSHEIFQALSAVYSAQAPALNRAYETQSEQLDILNQLGNLSIDSGHFKDLISESITVSVTYSIDQYLLLLNTYSPYLKLESESKQKLFDGLRQVLEQHGETIDLSYVSALHIAKPNDLN